MAEKSDATEKRKWVTTYLRLKSCRAAQTITARMIQLRKALRIVRLKMIRKTDMAALVTMALEPSVMYRQRGIKAMWLIHFLNRARQAT